MKLLRPSSNTIPYSKFVRVPACDAGSPAYIYVEIRTGFRSGNFRRFCFFYSVEILERNHPSSSTRMIINGRR